MNIGDKAPLFTLNDQHGKPVSLSDFSGSRVVVYFYSKDNTSGCTRQACAFAAVNSEFRRRGITVIGISKDSVESHKNLQKSTLCLLYSSLTRNLKSSKPTESGNPRNSTGKR